MTDLEMAKEIAKEVKKKGGSAYYVGGFVRDRLLNRESKDVDIEIHGISPVLLKSILESLGECSTKGASFGVFGLRHYNLDIAMPRSESSSGRGHKDFEIFVDPYLGLKKACSRRDFTINAMMEDIISGEIVDLYGGRKDLEMGIIRHVDSKTFLDDPLRVLRAAQFASRFNFSVAPETIRLCQSADLSALSSERIQTELEKALLKSKHPSIFFESLRKMEQLDVWFPELKALIGCEQDIRHHPEGDVWSHTMMVLDEAARVKDDASEPIPFLMSALYHDVGKPATTTKDEKGTHSYEHHTVGANMVKNIPYLQGRWLERYMSNMVEMHMHPHRLLKETKKPTPYCKMFFKSVDPRDLILLAQCDKLGRAGMARNDYDTNRQKLENYLSIYEERMAQPCVNGQDLIDAGFQPSPLFSEALAMGKNFQIAGTDKKSALSQVLYFMRKQERTLSQSNIKPWKPPSKNKQQNKQLKFEPER